MKIVDAITNIFTSDKEKDILPEWASVNEAGVIEVDADLAYPTILKELEIDTPDQYWVEVSYQFMKLHIQKAVFKTPLDPRRKGAPLKIRIKSSPEGKERWALNSFPKGRGVEAASKGLGARNHFKEIYGYVPQ